MAVSYLDSEQEDVDAVPEAAEVRDARAHDLQSLLDDAAGEEGPKEGLDDDEVVEDVVLTLLLQREV
jgi:hypothetical protein